MNDGINRIPPIRPAGYTVKPASAADRDKLDQGGGAVADRVDVDPDQASAPVEDKKEDISLSVSTIRIIGLGNLDPDIEAALTAFAPLGDLRGVERLCDMLDARGIEFISWPPHLSLAQAVEAATAIP